MVTVECLKLAYRFQDYLYTYYIQAFILLKVEKQAKHFAWLQFNVQQAFYQLAQLNRTDLCLGNECSFMHKYFDLCLE